MDTFFDLELYLEYLQKRSKTHSHMVTSKITSLSELWEHYQTVPVNRLFSTKDTVHDIASVQMNDVNDSHNDMYKSAIFKKLWNKSVIHLEEEIPTAKNEFYQPDLFGDLDEFPDYEMDEVIFSNGNFYTFNFVG